jgi:DNA-binding NtrC family response regulator
LRTHPWLGNVRELQNVIERAVILSTDKVLRMPLAELRSTQRIGKIKYLFSAASPVPSGACPMSGCLVGLLRGGGSSGQRPP